MKLDVNQAIEVVKDAILNNTVHLDYNSTIEYADRNLRWITGTNISVDLNQFVPREEEEAFKQRCNLTQTVTKPLISSVMRPFKKVVKSNRIVRRIKPKAAANVDAVNTIQDKFDRFYGSDDYDSGLDFWIRSRFFELSTFDPNAFIVIEHEPDAMNDNKLKLYPFEVSSDMAINFDIENNNIDWLLCRQWIYYKAKENDTTQQKGKRLTIYCDQFSYVYHQTSTDRKVAELNKPNQAAVYQYVGEGNKFAFWVNQYDNIFEDVAAFRVGYLRNPATAGRTFLVPFDDASPYLIKSIERVSQLDITTATNVFPKEYAYVTSCTGTITPDSENETPYCNKGRARNGEVCTLCKGSGVNVHKSGQDIVLMNLPDDPKEMFDLTKMRASFSPSVELLTFMDGQIDKFEPKIHKAIFNSTVMIDKIVQSQTATEADYDMDNVYDTLSDFGAKCKAVWLTIGKFAAVSEGVQEFVTFIYVNPSDWKLKTLNSLYNERKAINESGAPSFSKMVVDDDIAAIKLQDDTDAIISYEVKKKFFPFPGKTADEIAATMMQNYTPQSLKVLFQQFDWIFKQAELENTSFYNKNYKAQKDIIDKIVKRLIDELQPATPTFPIIAKEKVTEE